MEQENEILKAINALNEKMDKDFAEIKSEIKDIRNTIKVIPEMQNDILKMKNDVTGLKNDVTEIHEKIKVIPQIQKDIKDTKLEIRQLSRTVARIEIEHGKKLEALFDAFSMYSEKIDSLEIKVESCIHRLDKHDDEIYYLKSKIKI